MDGKNDRKWRLACSCKVAVRAQTKGAAILVMEGHRRESEGRHVLSAPYPMTKGDKK